jgi:hypothetical protein
MAHISGFERKCATGPKSKWQPKSALETQLQADGYKVRQIKVEGGCYEVYATDKDGRQPCGIGSA